MQDYWNSSSEEWGLASYAGEGNTEVIQAGLRLLAPALYHLH